ncbi:MAG TPA: TspO/MBR family protein [Thermoanaerobaculia bacterium]|nr:TspO/MBR family protein [Thermoanaerobaculia bacterium]
MISRWIGLIPFLGAVAVTAFIAGRFRPGAWYAALAKPSWTPPGWLFAPVWSLIYLAIAAAGWLVWRSGGAGALLPLGIWGFQLAANSAWSWLFFGRHLPAAALVDIVLLLAAIVAFILAARPFSTVAAGLFLPYAAWVLFAASLNAAIVRMNPRPS